MSIGRRPDVVEQVEPTSAVYEAVEGIAVGRSMTSGSVTIPITPEPWTSERWTV